MPLKAFRFFTAFVLRMDMKKQIERNWHQFYFYDDDEKEEEQTMLDYMWYLMFHVRLVLMLMKSS